MQTTIDLTVARPARSRALAALREGGWLTPDRRRVYPRLLGAALALAVGALVATSHHGIDVWNRPLGTDFVGVWVAGGEVRAGHPALPYDNAAHAAAQAAAFGPAESFLPWPYPPFFLMVAGALAGLPYLAALAVWQGGTLALYLAAVFRAAGRAAARREIAIAALSFPAVAINLMHGQNGFLSAGLIGLGAALLPRRPVAGGALLGLLAYKPQLALAVPVALAAGRHWRALAGAAAAVAAMTAATIAAYGLAPWQAFVANLGFTRKIILEAGGLESYKMQSAFAAARLVGAPVPVAYATQAVASTLVIAGLAWLWHGRHDPRLKLAGLALAGLLVSPYALDYDIVLVGVALAAMLGAFRGKPLPSYAASLMALGWLTPLLARPVAHVVPVPLGLLVSSALFGLVITAARRDAAAAPIATRHQP
ncbi:hypothetical protein RHAL1_00769 [Beijerinckiaceae bacterium RH AL1]|nr:hypothetical protein RHAL8_00737 [Beijerinckiaceae bacterium RH AL8]VVB43528.1 hypothetical protein RHCH11_RHCH11_00739 [Beijerinckiaceae bacterium RH CH11]VVC53878.1 hypothetical protein RHAL1_00769 [Beijerinckiaceae bacterium RH AL1]